MNKIALDTSISALNVAKLSNTLVTWRDINWRMMKKNRKSVAPPADRNMHVHGKMPYFGTQRYMRRITSRAQMFSVLHVTNYTQKSVLSGTMRNFIAVHNAMRPLKALVFWQNISKPMMKVNLNAMIVAYPTNDPSPWKGIWKVLIPSKIVKHQKLQVWSHYAKEQRMLREFRRTGS